MKKKSTHILIFCVLAVCVQFANSQSVSMQILKWDSSGKSLEISALNKLTFSGSNLVLNYTDTSNEDFQLSSIRKIIFNSSTGFTNNLMQNDAVQVYPNPASDFISIKKADTNITNLKIFTLNGVVIFSKNNLTENDKIDVRHLLRGFYLIKINDKVIKFTKL